MKKADILKQRELHRGDPRELVLNFAVNFSAPARLMHSLLPPRKGKEELLQAAMRAYVIGIAACTETFFRDLYFHLLKRNPGMLHRALNERNRKEPASRLPKYTAHGVSPEEFAAHQASFQNAEAINQNISIFFPSPFFDTLSQFDPICDIPSAQSDLGRVFSLRHEFAHDANAKTQISRDEMRRIETTALLICQMTALLPGIEPKVIVSERNLPAILLIADLISEDWEIADDELAAS
jgi:hypothetical protein